MEESIILKTENYVRDFFETKSPHWILYHNIEHTLDTVKACEEIGYGMNLNNEWIEILLLSAWFHDTGYLESPENHEAESVQVAKKFLGSINYDPVKLSRVQDCINSTKLSNVPKDLLQEIICDADLCSLGQKNYFELNDKLKIEIEQREKRKIDNFSWLKRSLHFLKSHHFYTNYAKRQFDKQLKKNIITIESMLSTNP